MTKNRILNLGLGVGLLITLAFISSCVPSEQPPAQGQGFDWTMIVFLVLIFAVFYFLVVRRRRTVQKEQQKTTQELKRGDQVITISGIYGEIESISEDSIVIKVESGATIRMAKNSIAGVRSKKSYQV